MNKITPILVFLFLIHGVSSECLNPFTNINEMCCVRIDNTTNNILGIISKCDKELPIPPPFTGIRLNETTSYPTQCCINESSMSKYIYINTRIDSQTKQITTLHINPFTNEVIEKTTKPIPEYLFMPDAEPDKPIKTPTTTTNMQIQTPQSDYSIIMYIFVVILIIFGMIVWKLGKEDKNEKK
jgi:hypothetical protein